MESIVIGTAGHIDHGKTALVKALTGRDTDTLEEERRRGITINLGFAYFTLPCGKIAGIVDVPGHERFIKNMLAGASGIDIVMVVIAANEGIMPQTREHIDILQYMHIQESVVVLTKIDMVDEEFKELVVEDTKEYLQHTFLKNAPLFEVDSLSGKGIEQLVSHINLLAERIQKRNSDMDARMSVDRVFSVKGFGTVVTGTLSDGVVRVDDEMMIYPQEIAAKVRGLQIHERDVKEAHTGQRVAMNLAGVTTEQVVRGSVVAKKGSVRATNVMDVHFSLTASTHATVKKMDKLKLYLGAKELVVKIVPLGVRQVDAGEEAYAQIMMEQEAVVRKGDTFVLRTISPVETVGGGRVVDPAVIRYKKVDDALLEAIRAKYTGAVTDVLEAFAKAHPFQSKTKLKELINADSIDAAMEQLLMEQRLICIQDRYLHTDTVTAAVAEINEILSEYHKKFPLRSGMPKAELQSRQTFAKTDKEFELLFEWMDQTKAVHIFNGFAARLDFAPSFSAKQEAIRAAMEQQLQEAGFTLLTKQELTESRPEKEQVLEVMLQDTLMVMEGQLVLSRAMYQQAREIVKNLASQNGVIKLSDFRDRLKTSRKYALLLLERFDKEKLTKRSGEDRVLL